MSTVEIDVPSSRGMMKISGEQRGSFIIHEMPDSALVGLNDISTWRVTHAKSGARFPWDFFTKEAAKAFADAVEAVLDWRSADVQPSENGNVGKWVTGNPSDEQRRQIDRLRLAHGGVRSSSLHLHSRSS